MSIFVIYNYLMMLRTLLFSLIFLFFFQAQAQTLGDRLFHSHGLSIGVFALPAYYTDPGSQDYEIIEALHVGWNYNLRLNLIEFSGNSSISINANPTLGIEASNINSHGFTRGGARLGSAISLNTGAGATHLADRNFGLGLSIGYDAYLFPLYAETVPDKIPKDTRFTKSLYVQLGMRYFIKRKNLLRSLNLRYNFRKPTLNNSEIDKPFDFTISWNKVINY